MRKAGQYRTLRLAREQAAAPRPGGPAAAPAPDLTKGIEVKQAVNGPIITGVLPFIPGAKKLTKVKKAAPKTEP